MYLSILMPKWQNLAFDFSISVMHIGSIVKAKDAAEGPIPADLLKALARRGLERGQ